MKKSVTSHVYDGIFAYECPAMQIFYIFKSEVSVNSRNADKLINSTVLRYVFRT